MSVAKQPFPKAPAGLLALRTRADLAVPGDARPARLARLGQALAQQK